MQILRYAGMVAGLMLVSTVAISQIREGKEVPLKDSLKAWKEYTYHSHSEIIDMYKQVCNKHPENTSYAVIGKTFENNDIWAFKIGNPDGGRIIIDGCLHGWEDLGTEVAYLWIQWLLESNDPVTKKILNENCWIVVPVINYDTYGRGNMNQSLCSGGVDMNRNFKNGWVFVPGCGGDYNTSHGASAASEKETQVMRSFMDKYKPSGNKKSVFINTHYGGGPWIHYSGKNVEGFYTPLRNRIIDLWNKNGIIIKNVTINNFLPLTSKNPAPGGEAGDAADFGYEAFTLEICNQNCRDGHKFAPVDAVCTGVRGESRHPSYSLFQTELYPIFKQVFIALSESVAAKM